MRRAFVVLALLISILAPARAQDDPLGDWRAQVSALLGEQTRAVRSGDEGAYLETLRGAPRSYREARRTWFRRMRALPVGSYTLTLATHTYDDLAPALATVPAGDEVHVVEAAERIGFRGYDEVPAEESVFLTLVRRGDRWFVHGDGGLDDLGLQSSRNMWDFAPVQTVERGGVLVMFHSERSTALRILDETIDAIARVRASWPLGWRERVIVMIPRSADDLQRILATTIDLSPFVAFAASSAIREEDGTYGLGGNRIFVQPDTFFGYSASFQRETLGHEILHYATRHLAGPFTPSWLEEGVAQTFGEEGSPATSELRGGARRVDGLPPDHRFFIGSRSRIRLSYQSSAHALGVWRDRFGARAVARFYRAVGAESPVSFGTGRYHLDRAARKEFGVPFDDLERAWLRQAREEFS